MATLTGELISETYDSLLKVTDNNTITGIKKRITDGFGNDIPLLLSSTDIEIDGTLILSALNGVSIATKFLSLKSDNSVGFRTASDLLSDIGGASSSSISGTTGRLSKFTSSGAVGNSILEEIGNAIHLTNAGSSFASFGINNPGIDNDCFIGSTINNDFLIKINNVEALRIDTALRLKIANIQNALGDTDKFLVSEDGVVKYRTGDELRADIGAGVGSVTSVGLTMPVAFSVANSPITSSGTLAVTAVGTASQYIRGDGQLATLPTGAGGGSAVNYYLNGSIASSVMGYQQMDNSAVIGAGTDFNLVGNGLVAQFLTDVGNPNRLLIPGGAWNLEMFFSVSSAGGNQKFYVDLLKYNGTTFSLIATTSGNPEEITGGTATDLYLTSLAVPETVLLTTDRLAIRVYIVDNAVGRTVTLHTEDNNLCQIITTFAGGISALNGLTANTQYFAVGTSGTDFAISSTLDTHTFNLPTASATNRGALSTTDWTTFNNKVSTATLAGYVPYTGATGSVNLGLFDLTSTNGYFSYAKTSLLEINSGTGQYIDFKSSTTANARIGFNVYTNSLRLDSGSTGGSNNAEFYVNNIKWLSASATGEATLSGNTSIGYTTNPSLYKLDVNGTGRFASNVTYNGASATDITNIWNVGGITYGYTGVSGGNDSIIIGSVLGDLSYRSVNKSILFSTNNGNSVSLRIASTGAATFSGNIGDSLIIGNVAGNYIKMGGMASSTSYLYSFETAFNVGNSYSGGSLNLYAGNASRLSIASTGAATFSNSVTALGGVFNGTPGIVSALTINNTASASSYRTLITFSRASTNLYNLSLDASDSLTFNNAGNNSSFLAITSGGNVLIGTTANPGSGNYKTVIEQTGYDGLYISVNQSPGGHALRLNRLGDGDLVLMSRSGTNVGSISVSGSETFYNASSDYRLKQDLKEFNGLDLISKIKTYDYEWKSNNKRSFGVLAHELQDVIPSIVTGEKDGKESQQVDYSKLVPILVKAIQELKAEIDILKNK